MDSIFTEVSLNLNRPLTISEEYIIESIKLGRFSTMKSISKLLLEGPDPKCKCEHPLSDHDDNGLCHRTPCGVRCKCSGFEEV